MSRIEQLIGEIEEYIDSCKFQPLSTTKILVNKEELEELLVELRLRIPDEVKKYQKIISQEDSILNDARTQADNMISEATSQSQKMIDENEITDQARQYADQIVADAQQQAQDIVDAAVADADAIRQSAINYTDDMLRSLQTIIVHALEDCGASFNTLQESLQTNYDIVTSNRSELAGNVSTGEEG